MKDWLFHAIPLSIRLCQLTNQYGSTVRQKSKAPIAVSP